MMPTKGNWMGCDPPDPPDDFFSRREEVESLLEQAEDDDWDVELIEHPEPCDVCGDDDWCSLDCGLTLQCLNCGFVRAKCRGEEEE